MNSDQDKIKITPCRNGWIVRVKVTDYYDEYVYRDYKELEEFLKIELVVSRKNQEIYCGKQLGYVF